MEMTADAVGIIIFILILALAAFMERLKNKADKEIKKNRRGLNDERKRKNNRGIESRGGFISREGGGN
jgi:hypothetical protein